MLQNRDELDRLISNLDERQIMNLVSILDLYITERSLDEIKTRIETEDMNPSFEWKMRGIAEFKKFVEERLKE